VYISIEEENKKNPLNDIRNDCQVENPLHVSNHLKIILPSYMYRDTASIATYFIDLLTIDSIYAYQSCVCLQITLQCECQVYGEVSVTRNCHWRLTRVSSILKLLLCLYTQHHATFDCSRIFYRLSFYLFIMYIEKFSRHNNLSEEQLQRIMLLSILISASFFLVYDINSYWQTSCLEKKRQQANRRKLE